MDRRMDRQADVTTQTVCRDTAHHVPFKRRKYDVNNIIYDNKHSTCTSISKVISFFTLSKQANQI